MLFDENAQISKVWRQSRFQNFTWYVKIVLSWAAQNFSMIWPLSFFLFCVFLDKQQRSEYNDIIIYDTIHLLQLLIFELTLWWFIPMQNFDVRGSLTTKIMDGARRTFSNKTCQKSPVQFGLMRHKPHLNLSFLWPVLPCIVFEPLWLRNQKRYDGMVNCSILNFQKLS